MRRVAQVVVLCEDKQQQVFFRMLKEMGYHRRSIRPLPVPEGAQAAEQYVRENYPREVAGHRANTVSCCLVLAVDADMLSVSQRARQLDDELDSRGMPRRQAGERIALFIPKRNIETWIRYLTAGGPVDETTEYPKLRRRESDCQPAVIAFIALARPPDPLPADCPPSLRAGRDEFHRVPEAAAKGERLPAGRRCLRRPGKAA